MTTQLRIRTEYSFKEAFGPLPRVISQLKQVGASSAGMVEIGGGTWGHIQWDKACRAADIQPMFGAEWACTATYDPDAEVRPLMWALARDTRALYNATTLAHSQLVRGMPSLTHEQALAAQGLVKFAGGALATEELVAHPDTYIDVNPSSALSQRRAAALARRTGRPLVITSDNYYPAHTDIKTFGYVGRQQKPTPQWILNWKDPHLRMAFPGLTDEELASAVRGAAEVAEQLQGVKLHKAPLISVSGDLRSLCEAGREARAIAGWGPTYVERLDRELALIHEKQFESYFLVVADMVRWAKQRMLVGPARGSAAGSLVCYLLGITEVDPIPYGLIFERFVDVTRADLPDIDLDFPDAQRDLVYEYLAERYGRENVARIGTIGSYKPKSALVQVCKRLGIPPFETFAVKNAMFVRSSGDSRANNCLIDTLNETAPGREFLEKYPAAAAAGDLEGHAAGTGVHAAGVCVCNEPVSNFCTVASGVMQVDKYDAEALNLLKIDALGLRTLGIIEDTRVVTREQLYSLTFDDPKVFQLFNERKYAGIFQWEGRALQSVTDQLRITRFDDLEQITALARPGPLGGGAATRYIERHEGREQHSYPHASMGEYLDESYGLVLYQEQVLRMCREIGHMSWDDATLLRKAMSKSYGKEYFDKFGEKFIAGAAQEGISAADAQAIWDQINSMGSWSFNKSHSVSYAIVSYWTAWLKAHYPLEYAAACLRHAKDDQSVVDLLRELTREGIRYIAFDPERSAADWSVQDGVIVGGFKNIVGVGDSKAEAFIAARAAGKYTDSQQRILEAPEVKYSALYPVHEKYSDYFTKPEEMGLRAGSRLTEIRDFPEEGEVVFIALMTEKDQRDENETIRVQRRKGRRVRGPSLFCDLAMVDDSTSTPITLRVDRWQYEPYGRLIMERAVENKEHFLIRGHKIRGYPMVKFERIKCLSNPGLFHVIRQQPQTAAA